MTRYAKRKSKYSDNENFNLLPYVEWDRFVTLTGVQAEWGLRYRSYQMPGIQKDWKLHGHRKTNTRQLNKIWSWEAILMHINF